jgi:hypothetical protein
MLMLGRCLPHIVPNVLLAKREVRPIKVPQPRSPIMLFICGHFEVQCYIFILLKSVTCNHILTFMHASLLLENGFTPLSGEFSKTAWYSCFYQFCLKHYQLLQHYYCRSIYVPCKLSILTIPVD